MTRLLAIIKKEWLLLLRDFAGLLVIFILPMALVLFLSLTQSGGDNGGVTTNLVVATQSNNKTSQNIMSALEKVKNFKITKISDEKAALDQAKQAVNAGKYQALIVIPAGIDNTLKTFATNLRAPNQQSITSHELTVWFDPGLNQQIRDSLKLTLTMLTEKLNQQLKNQIFIQTFPNAKQSIDAQIVSLQANTTGPSEQAPNAVQQNVPAWAIFGMFFIVIPLAGVMVRERQSGVMQRLQLAPVSSMTLLIGKLMAFLSVNVIQLWLMILEGVFLLPMFGLPALVISGHLLAIWSIAICTGLAATGFGLLIGAYVKTFEQASIVAPFVVVIAAAIGGILVPYSVMPLALQHIADYSPLYWSLNAFLDVFVRQASVIDIKGDLFKLLIFFVVVISIAALRMRSHKARITGQ